MSDVFACVGDNCIDRFLPPADECLVGGNAVNVAVQLAMLGRRVHYFGAVGDDAAGDAVIHALAVRGVGVSHVQRIAGRCTAYTDIEMSAEGERSFVFEDFGACAAYRVPDEDVAFLAGVRHVHIGWLDDGGALKRALRRAGVTVSQDLSVNNTPENLDPSGLDLAFCSAEPARAEHEAERLLRAGAKLAAVTLGAEGSFASDGHQSFRQTALPITAEDTTGAGDAFIAGFLDAWVSRQALDGCLLRGAQLASAACMHRGGFAQAALKDLPLGQGILPITDS